MAAGRRRRGGVSFCWLCIVSFVAPGAAMACLWLYEAVAAPGGPARGRSSRPIGFQRHPTPCVESSLRIFPKHPASHGQLPQRTARGKKGSPKVQRPRFSAAKNQPSPLDDSTRPPRAPSHLRHSRLRAQTPPSAATGATPDQHQQQAARIREPWPTRHRRDSPTASSY